jgi:hypothetical protein
LIATPIRRNESAIVTKAGNIKNRGIYEGCKTAIASRVELPRRAIVATAELKLLGACTSLLANQNASERKIKLINHPTSVRDPNSYLPK